MTADQQFWLAVLAQIVTVVGLILTYLKTRGVSGQVTELHAQTNSRMDELVASTERAAHGEGLAEGLKRKPR